MVRKVIESKYTNCLGLRCKACGLCYIHCRCKRFNEVQMIGVLRVKEGVQFAVIAPGGARIIGCLDLMARMADEDLTITSGTDGEHSGPDDPHHRGEAYDIRTHDLADKQKTLSVLRGMLGSAFYAFLEDPGTPNEHIHCQVAKGTVYPPQSGSL